MTEMIMHQRRRTIKPQETPKIKTSRKMRGDKKVLYTVKRGQRAGKRNTPELSLQPVTDSHDLRVTATAGSCLLTEPVFVYEKLKSLLNVVHFRNMQLDVSYFMQRLVCPEHFSVIHSERSNFVILMFFWKVEPF